jgi:hypothetical protein
MKKLNSWLRPNPLTEDPNDFVAVPVTVGTAGVNEIVAELVGEGLELRVETVIDVISRFNRKTAQMLTEGYNINTGLLHIRPVIKGAFYGKTWNPEKNALVANITPGATLRTAIAETEVVILGEQPDMLSIMSLTDSTTGLTDGSLTKGRNAEIKGSYLKIVGENPNCGISFTNTETQAVTRLEATDIVLNEPSRLLIFVPASLATGEYTLTVMTQYSGTSRPLKEPRSAVFAPVNIG